MYIPPDVILVLLALAVLWMIPSRQEKPPPRTPRTPPAPPDISQQIHSCTMFQSIAQARGDWRMADHYRDEATRLVAQQDTDRLAYNRALRTRILGADRAKDYESPWKGNPHGEELS